MPVICTSVNLTTARNLFQLKDRKIREMNRSGPFLWITVTIPQSDLCALGKMNLRFCLINSAVLAGFLKHRLGTNPSVMQADAPFEAPYLFSYPRDQ